VGRCGLRRVELKTGGEGLARLPAWQLRGTIRDHVTQERRPFLRFFACQEDLSHESPDAPLPDQVAAGEEPYLIVGALAGG